MALKGRITVMDQVIFLDLVVFFYPCVRAK